MRKLSRHMPPSRNVPTTSCPTSGCWAVAALAIAVFVIVVPPAVTVPLAALCVVVAIRDRRRAAKRAAERRGDSICTFARSFPRRSVDPWVVRALYEELPRALASSDPPRASDRFDEDFRMLDEDLEDLIVDVAERAGRSLDALEENPHHARIETVGDVARFLSAQPPSPAGLALRPYLRGSS